MGIFIRIDHRGENMLIEIIVLSLIIGKIRGGKIKNLAQIRFKGWYLLLLGFLLEIISLWFFANQNGILAKIIIDKFFIIQIFTYILLILGLGLNIRKRGIKTILLGTMLNFIPIIANNGRMPVSKTGLEKLNLYKELELLQANKILTHVLTDENTRLYCLSDIIPIFKPNLFSKIISIGDILIAMGIFLLIQFYMKKFK